MVIKGNDMKCPRDGAELLTSNRRGVAIDLCPTCQGIWLDRGELEKLIALAIPPTPLAEPERAEKKTLAKALEPKAKPANPTRQREVKQGRVKSVETSPKRKKKRRREFDFEDFLEDLFDFD